MEEERNAELAFLETLLKRGNGNIPRLGDKKPTYTEQ